jgi:eukaryotic-like serine/threonine-protein kinase
MKLGKYEVLAELGRGAMGVVYSARDPIINRLVAIKTITTGLAGDTDLRQRFYREAQSAGSLQHPNIVTIHDMGEQDHVPHIVMELIEGDSLESLIVRRAPLPISLKLVYATQACRAFDYAHKRGIVHRDIKPANVMITKEGVVKVVDFGIARVAETSKTRTGMLIGTFAYMSPEQYEGEHADERSDIWAFGVLLYEMLSFHKPFAGETPASLMRSISEQHPKPLTEYIPGCPPEIENVVTRCLQKSPRDRFQSMQEVLLDLEPICKNLQEQSVTELTDQSRRHVEKNQFSEARDLLRQALQIEPDNQRVRAMFESVSAELKRILVRPKVRQFVEQGRMFLQERKTQDAKLAAENALNLDSTFEPARELQRVIRDEMERAQLVVGWVEAARQHLAEGLPEEAEALLIRALQVEPDNKQAAILRQQAAKEKVERQNRLRLLERLQQARNLWTRQEYHPCIQLLVDLEREFPGEEEVIRLLETVRDDQMDQRRHSMLDAQNLLEACHFQECFSLLAKLQEQFPGDQEINALLETGRKSQMDHRRLQGLTEAKGFVTSGEYDQGITLLTALQKEFPDEPEILALLDDARERQADRRKQQSLTRARELLAGRRYADSAGLLMNLKKEFPGDAQILKLLDTVRSDQAAQRRRDGLAEARRLMASRYYDEAIAVLTDLQADFPEETAIAKLLETARGDKAEQQKQQKLIEARAHLASQSFAEALTLLDALAAAHPKDASVSKLLAMARHEHEKHARDERIQRELDALKKLMSERNYPEVMSRTKELLTEFPEDTNFRRMAEFAAGQQESAEKELLLKNAIQEATAFFNGRRYKECMAAAQNGLKAAPGNAELLRLFTDAEAQQKKRAVHEQIEERVRQIRGKINREEFSDAIDLARETLRNLGPDTNVSQLLNSAQVEFDARERKSSEGHALETIRTLIESGEIEAAGRVLDEALETKTADGSDPHFQQLAARIREAKPAPPPDPATATDAVPPAVSNEYALFQSAPLPPDPPPPELLRGPTTSQGAATKRALSPRPSADDVAQGAPPDREVAEPAQPAVVNSAEPAGTTAGTPFERSKAPEQVPFGAPPFTTQKPHPVRRSTSSKPLIVTMVLLGVAAAVLVGLRFDSVSKLWKGSGDNLLVSAPIIPEQTAGLEAQQRAALAAAGKLIATNDLDGARAQLQKAAELKGPLTEELKKRISEIDASKSDPQLRQLREREEQLWQKALKSVDSGRYMEAQKGLRQILQLGPGGLHRDDAQMYLNKVIPQHLQEIDLLTQARLDLAQNEFQSARGIAGQLRQNGTDPAKLLAEIDQKERSELAQLEKQFNDLSRRDDDEAVLALNALWPKFQELAAAGGPVSGEALDYVNKIPETVIELQARMKQKSADSLFERTVQAYQQAARLSDKNGLTAARTNFQSIAQGGGPHAEEAQKYLDEVSKKLSSLSPSSPSPANAGSSPATDRENAVRATMQLYVHAFEQRDVDALRQIWPSIGAQYEGFKLWFENAKAVRMQMQIESMQFDPDGTSVVVKAQVQREQTPVDSKTTRIREPETFQLSKLNGSWVITDVDANF